LGSCGSPGPLNGSSLCVKIVSGYFNFNLNLKRYLNEILFDSSLFDDKHGRSFVHHKIKLNENSLSSCKLKVLCVLLPRTKRMNSLCVQCLSYITSSYFKLCCTLNQNNKVLVFFSHTSTLNNFIINA